MENNKQKLNVLFLAEELRVGGAETYFYTIENRVNRDKINFFSMAVDGEMHKRLKHPESYMTYSFGFFNRIKETRIACKKYNIDIIHANSLRLAIVASIVKRKWYKDKIDVIYTKHNLTILEKISNKLFKVFLNKYVDVVNAICENEKKHMMDIGVNADKIQVIYNGIELEKFAVRDVEPQEVVNVGILARLSPEKNHGLFLNIAKEILLKNDKFKFYIGGEGPERQKIETEIINLGLQDKVVMEGYVSAAKFLEKMDYVLLVSEREVFPMTLIEAMAKGCIVVAKNVGGISEMVFDDNGYLVEGDDPKKYADIILSSVLKDESAKIEKSRKLVEEKFTINNMVVSVEDMYEHCKNI